MAQQGPGSWRILQLPQPIGHKRHFFVRQCEEPLAEYPELLQDPTQRMFGLSSSPQRQWTLMIPVEVLTRAMCSTHANPYIEWGRWGRDVVRVHIHRDVEALKIAGTKLLAFCTSRPRSDGHCLEMYDLSKSGRRGVEFRQFNEGECRMVLPGTEWFSQCRIEGSPLCVCFMGNNLVCLYVSLEHARSGFCDI